jgi:hypothetical protein
MGQPGLGRVKINKMQVSPLRIRKPANPPVEMTDFLGFGNFSKLRKYVISTGAVQLHRTAQWRDLHLALDFASRFAANRYLQF